MLLSLQTKSRYDANFVLTGTDKQLYQVGIMTILSFQWRYSTLRIHTHIYIYIYTYIYIMKIKMYGCSTHFTCLQYSMLHMSTILSWVPFKLAFSCFGYEGYRNKLRMYTHIMHIYADTYRYAVINVSVAYLVTAGESRKHATQYQNAKTLKKWNKENSIKYLLFHKYSSDYVWLTAVVFILKF